MTFADEIRSAESALVGRMRASFEAARRQHRQNRAFRRTYRELSQLTDRELYDLGIARSMIAQVARSSVRDL